MESSVWAFASHCWLLLQVQSFDIRFEQCYVEDATTTQILYQNQFEECNGTLDTGCRSIQVVAWRTIQSGVGLVQFIGSTRFSPTEIPTAALLIRHLESAKQKSH